MGGLFGAMMANKLMDGGTPAVAKLAKFSPASLIADELSSKKKKKLAEESTQESGKSLLGG
mgnify:FL=1|tara:strand:- start:269 stop:451 length:183 start_codon:yes stop_codon:yes gene_type:complete